MSQDKHHYKHHYKQPLIIDQKSKANFNQHCMDLKHSLNHIDQDPHINSNNTYSDHDFDLAFSGPLEKDRNLTTIYQFYITRDNTEYWGNLIIQNYDFIVFTSMLDFLESLKCYFSTTIDLKVSRKLLKLNNTSTTNLELVYKVWRAHLEDSIKKIDMVLNLLRETKKI